MDNQLRRSDEFEEAVGNLVKGRLVRQELGRKPVYFDGTGIDIPLRVDIDMVLLAGRRLVDEFERADLDDPVAVCRVDAGGFGIEDDFTHCRGHSLFRSQDHAPARRGSKQARRAPPRVRDPSR